ncbi:hypothetical protein [Paenibacillus alba]|uniref:Uncharacterized protein n=1 Tax=Paenibacillus alba TaxID=1197127 RepID=A0ABU6FYM6_9BACL|nr:hypothetical protein [Paenibacillus alba]MEC0225639.1 hypothetical protein [Paenibacillus alba]
MVRTTPFHYKLENAERVVSKRPEQILPDISHRFAALVFFQRFP